MDGNESNKNSMEDSERFEDLLKTLENWIWLSKIKQEIWDHLDRLLRIGMSIEDWFKRLQLDSNPEPISS